MYQTIVRHSTGGNLQIVIYGNNSAFWVKLPNLPQLTSQHSSLLSRVRKSVHFWTLIRHLSETSEIRVLDSCYILSLALWGHHFGLLHFTFPICKVGYYLASLGTEKKPLSIMMRRWYFSTLEVWWTLCTGEELFLCQASLIATMTTVFQARVEGLSLSDTDNVLVTTPRY